MTLTEMIMSSKQVTEDMHVVKLEWAIDDLTTRAINNDKQRVIDAYKRLGKAICNATN